MQDERVVKVLLFTTLGCHLCEEAETLWQQWLEKDQETSRCFQLVPTEIAEDTQLVELYGVRIPVLKRGDNEAELGWPFDLPGLQRFMAAD